MSVTFRSLSKGKMLYEVGVGNYLFFFYCYNEALKFYDSYR